MTQPHTEREREFRFTNEDFAAIATLVEGQTGIRLPDSKREMVYSRLSRRLRQLGIQTFAEYCQLVAEEESSDELGQLINAVTTNLTSFFREKHHFEYLAASVLPQLLSRPERRLRIWSAGCSTGEEPYSIAMVVAEALRSQRGVDARILASDLDSNVVETGQRGVYTLDRVRDLAPERVNRWFMRGTGANAGYVRVRDELRQLISFRQLNLLNEWPFRGPFDVIFCRNVVIYFSKEVQRRLFDRFADMLVPDGHLFIGHSESLFKVSERFQLVGNTIYRRTS